MGTIHIDNWPARPIHTGSKLRILDAALEADVPFPHACRSGECGSCKCEVLEGDVHMDTCSPDALSKAERADGLILACRARVIGDARIRWLASAAQARSAAVASLERIAHDVVALDLQIAQPLDFRPGQYAQLRVDGLPTRNYSMANQPGEEKLQFHVRIVPGGAVSTHVAHQLRVGDAVEVSAPFGDACWRTMPRDETLLLLAGGTGLAPMLSVLDAALRDGHPPQRIHLFHGVRTARDLYADQALRQRADRHGFEYVGVCAHAADGAAGLHMHQALAPRFDAFIGARIFTAGPPPMVDAVRALAIERGCDPRRLHADPFFAATPLAAEPSKRHWWKRLTRTAA